MRNNIFRLNPIFEITPTGELTEKQKIKFQHITEKRNVYGLLHAPVEAKVTVKALNALLANFLEQLREPKKLSDLPPDFSGGSASEIRRLVIQLVLDSVLEVRFEGGFISGVEAVNKVLLSSARSVKSGKSSAKNRIQALSKEAIELAMNSVFKYPRNISRFLYVFNYLPLCRRWRLRFADEESIADYLNLNADNTWSGMPKCIKAKQAERDEKGNIKSYDQYWRYWYMADKTETAEKLNYKIYVSPSLEDLPDVFKIVRESIVHSKAYSMKIGQKVSEIFRSDKFIIYFTNHADAFDFAKEISEKTGSYRALSVPFTYQVSPFNPMISLGVDPPKKFGEKHSWRSYVTDNLALAIQSAQRAGADNPMEYIYTHMHMIGIDINDWRPVNRDWSIEFDLDETSV